MRCRRALSRTGAALLLAVAATAGCTGSRGTASPTATTTAGTHARVHVLGLWSGPEFDSFDKVQTVWEKRTGNTVDWQSSQDLAADLAAALRAGKPPDIAILPNLALLRQLAAQHKLVPLERVLSRTRLDTDYAPAWRALGSVRGAVYGIFYKVNSKSTVWYDPAAFASDGYRVPSTWTQLTALTRRMLTQRHTPWSVVAASGPAAGWPLTDWVAQLVLGGCGPDVYDHWVAGSTAWTTGCIRQAFERFLSIVRTRGNVLGGTAGIVSTTDSDGGLPLYTTPPKAYLYYLASFAQAFIAQAAPHAKPGSDYGFFAFPTIDPRYAGSVTVGADIIVMVHDTPAARSLMSYLAGASAQEQWIRLGGFTSVNRSVPASTYRDEVARAVAAQLTSARTVRFGAGDLMPPQVQRAWWAAMLQLVKNPDQLGAELVALTKLASSAR